MIRAVMKQKRAVAAASPAVVVYCTSEITLRSTMKNRNRKADRAGARKEAFGLCLRLSRRKRRYTAKRQAICTPCWKSPYQGIKEQSV